MTDAILTTTINGAGKQFVKTQAAVDLTAYQLNTYKSVLAGTKTFR